MIEPLVTALLDLSVLLLQGAQILLPLLALLVQCPVPLARLGQAGGQFGELLREGFQSALPLGFAVLQGLHVRVVTQLIIQLRQLLLQRLALLFDLFQRQSSAQLLLELSLLLLQLLLQFAQLRQGSLLMLQRQGFQPQLEAGQLETPRIRIGQGRSQGMAIEPEILCTQGQHWLGQHLVQRSQLRCRQEVGQLLVQVLSLGAHLLSDLRQLLLDSGQFALDGRWRAALCLVDTDDQRIAFFLQFAAARFQYGAVGNQGKTLLQLAQLFALLVKLRLFLLALVLLAGRLNVLLAQALQLDITLRQFMLQGLLAGFVMLLPLAQRLVDQGAPTKQLAAQH